MTRKVHLPSISRSEVGDKDRLSRHFRCDPAFAWLISVSHQSPIFYFVWSRLKNDYRLRQATHIYKPVSRRCPSQHRPLYTKMMLLPVEGRGVGSRRVPFDSVALLYCTSFANNEQLKCHLLTAWHVCSKNGRGLLLFSLCKFRRSSPSSSHDIIHSMWSVHSSSKVTHIPYGWLIADPYTR